MRCSLLGPVVIVKKSPSRACATSGQHPEFAATRIQNAQRQCGEQDWWIHVLFSGPTMESDLLFMQKALEEAHAAALAGEVPIGAVLVHDGEMIARSGNRTIRDIDPTAHAEMVVLREGARLIGNHRLAGVTLYVTLEPCSMCAGAMIQARIPRLVYGCDDPKGGAVRTCFQLLSDARLNHRVDATAGLLAEECAAVLQAFFAMRR
jgi:tRNA(adenine34) deaminase